MGYTDHSPSGVRRDVVWGQKVTGWCGGVGIKLSFRIDIVGNIFLACQKNVMIADDGMSIAGKTGLAASEDFKPQMARFVKLSTIKFR